MAQLIQKNRVFVIRQGSQKRGYNVAIHGFSREQALDRLTLKWLLLKLADKQ